MFNLPIIDIIVIVCYFLMVIIIGIWSSRRIKNQEDYFLAGRRFGKIVQTFAAFGQATSAESGTTTTIMVRNNGVAGIWAGISGGLVSMPFLWMSALWYRRMRYLTLADFFTERYGSKKMAGFYSFFQAIFFMIVVALSFNALGKTIAAMTPKPMDKLTSAEIVELENARELERLEDTDYDMLSGDQQKRLDSLRLQNPRLQFSYIDLNTLIIVIGVVVLLYAVSGGLEAAFLTDTIQGIFTIILSLLLIPFAIMKLNAASGTSGVMGTFKALHYKLPQSFFEIWGSPAVMEFTWYWMLAFALLSTTNVFVQANQLTACGSAKDEYTARFGLVSGIFLKRYSSVIWGFVALMTVAIYSDQVKNPDYLWGYAARDLLGPLNIGLTGLLIACMMAALMSLADCLMLTAASLLTNNIYKPMKPNMSEKHYIWVGRFFSFIFISASVLIALQFKTVFAMFKLIWMFNCILSASFLIGMLWRRANRYAAWSSMIITAAFTILLPVIVPVFSGVRTSEKLLKTTNPEPVVRTYLASGMDVTQREKMISDWEKMSDTKKQIIPKPQALQVGQSFEKTFKLPRRSIFWSEDIELNDKGQLQGAGMLKVELVAIDWMGFDLTKNSYSLNETLTALARLIIPFGVVILVSLFTPMEDKKRLDMFYVKMKTKVCRDRNEDQRQLMLSYQNPHRFDDAKLFPNSNWEFRKWQPEDTKGIVLSILGSAGCFLLFYMLVSIGR